MIRLICLNFQQFGVSKWLLDSPTVTVGKKEVEIENALSMYLKFLSKKKS